MNLSDFSVSGWPQVKWDALLDRPPRLRVASVLAMGALAALLPGLLGAWWLADDLAAEAASGRSLGDRLAQQQHVAVELPKLRQQQSELNQTLAMLEPSLVAAGSAPALWLQVQAQAQAQSLQLDVFEPGASLPQADYVVLPATLRLRGSYAQLTRLAATLAASTPAVTVRRWSLQPGPDGRLTADLSLVAYQRLGEGQGAAPRAALADTAFASTRALLSALPPALVQALAQLTDPFAAPAPSEAANPPASFELASLQPPGPLQGVLLKDITLVGTLAEGGPPGQQQPLGRGAQNVHHEHSPARMALLRVGGRVYPVRVGDVLGPDQGEVIRIETNAVVLSERVRQPSGTWAKRESRLALGGQGS